MIYVALSYPWPGATRPAAEHEQVGQGAECCGRPGDICHSRRFQGRPRAVYVEVGWVCVEVGWVCTSMCRGRLGRYQYV